MLVCVCVCERERERERERESGSGGGENVYEGVYATDRECVLFFWRGAVRCAHTEDGRQMRPRTSVRCVGHNYVHSLHFFNAKLVVSNEVLAGTDIPQEAWDRERGVDN